MWGHQLLQPLAGYMEHIHYRVNLHQKTKITYRKKTLEAQLTQESYPQLTHINQKSTISQKHQYCNTCRVKLWMSTLGNLQAPNRDSNLY